MAMYRCLFLIVLFIALSSRANAQPWPTLQFDVVNVEPSGLTDSDRNIDALVRTLARLLREVGIDPDVSEVFDEYLETVPLDPETKVEIDSLLFNSAVKLQEWGFPPPRLEPMVELEDGSLAYRVYLVSGLEDAAGSYHGHLYCENSLRREWVILLDADDVLSGGFLSEWGAQTVAHELFHAVQFATPLYQNCGSVGSWILEGQASAVGVDLARIVQGESMPNYPETVVGLRNYSERLPVVRNAPTEERRRGYRTSSFWRFPMTLIGDGSSFSYEYLVPMLRRTAPAHDCRRRDDACAGEIEWLDESLQDVFSRGLREVYADFILAYSNYGLQHYASLQMNGGERAWWEETYDEACREVDLTSDTDQRQHRTIIDRFEDISAQCWKVNVSGFDTEDVLLRMTAVGPSQAARLAQLTAIRARGDHSVAPAEIEQALPGDTQRATWTYTLRNGEETVLLLTNVADAAEATLPILNLEVTITALQEGVSMAESSATPQDLPDALPIELDAFVGGISAGQNAEVCHFTLRARNRSTGDAIGLEMDHLGSIGPGMYPMSPNDHPAYFPREDAPKNTIVGGFDLGVGNPMSGGKTQTFFWQSGTVNITSVEGGFIEGEVRGLGWRDPDNVVYGEEPFGTDSFSIIARFAFENGVYAGLGDRCIGD